MGLLRVCKISVYVCIVVPHKSLKKATRAHLPSVRHPNQRSNLDICRCRTVCALMSDLANLRFVPHLSRFTHSSASHDGIKFMRSDNGVILTNGDGGVLHPRYFQKVVEWPSGKPVAFSVPDAGHARAQEGGVAAAGEKSRGIGHSSSHS